MKKIIRLSLITLLSVTLLTGCGGKKSDNKANDIIEKGESEKTVVEDQIFEGLEFVNVGSNEGSVKTIVINNTGYKYEGSKFSMKIMDENGDIIVELQDEVKEPMETGTTKEVVTKTNADLSKAAAIEYSIISK